MNTRVKRSEPPTALIFACADRWHDMKGLAATISEHAARAALAKMSIVDAPSALESDELETSDCCIVCLFATGLTKPQEGRLLAFVRNGGGLLGIHTAACERSPGFADLLGGAFLEHAPCGEMSVVILDHEHPITKGLKDFTIEDELYSCRCQPGLQVLAAAPFKGKDEPMVWTKSYGQGRVCYVALGHNAKSYSNANFLELTARALRWVTPPANREGD